jgi:glycosyltransferase involved in cell wall biosynthesis
MRVGINASRARSGGAKSHLIGVLNEVKPELYGIKEIHVWSYDALLDLLPNKIWLVKHSVQKKETSIFKELLWERYTLNKELKAMKCSILLNIDAGTVCDFSPAVTMSRDMLSYEPGELKRYGFSYLGLRLFLLRYVQNRSLSRANGVIFLSKYASEVIQKSCGKLKNIAIIPHGIGDNFKLNHSRIWPIEKGSQIKCLYVSPIWLFKHQWTVVKAIEHLRGEGFNLDLYLVGSNTTKDAMKLLESQLMISDPEMKYVTLTGEVEHAMLTEYYKHCDIFIFASSCENMPNTLIEAMGAGLPIACSDRGPMPEILKDGGIFFNPEDTESLIFAIREIINNINLREKIVIRGKELSEQYSWSRCADETFKFIAANHMSNEIKKTFLNLSS